MNQKTYTHRGGVRPPEHTRTTANKGRQTLPLRWMAAIALLLMTACGNDDEVTTHDPITLTTPHIELGEVTADATSRSVIGAEGSAVEVASLDLYMLDADGNKQGKTAKYVYYDQTKWKTPYQAPVVQDGAGQYYAGLTAAVTFTSTETMPAFDGAKYVYRGYVTVTEDGTFTPGAPLSPMTAAVQVKLKDANGSAITGDAAYLYLCSYDGLYMFANYSTGTDGKKFPMGEADPAILCTADNSLYPLDRIWGYYASGTYPATLTEKDAYGCGKMVSATTVPTAPWKLFTIHYCPDGFEWSNDARNYVPLGDVVTWTVNYPAATLKLEAGKLYTFTVTLGSDRAITLGSDAVSISSWTEGDAINIGK